MNVKRYFAPTAREALRALKEALGPDAIVLSNRAVEGGVEILALPGEAVGALQAANREQGLGQTRQSTRDSGELQELISTQQQQRRELEEIEKMLRAIIARGENEDQQILSQAQQASRAIRPIREQMSTSGRVLSNGMVNLAVDIEQEIGDSLEELSMALQAMNNVNNPRVDDPVQQAARDTAELMEQM